MPLRWARRFALPEAQSLCEPGEGAARGPRHGCRLRDHQLLGRVRPEIDFRVPAPLRDLVAVGRGRLVAADGLPWLASCDGAGRDRANGCGGLDCLPKVRSQIGIRFRAWVLARFARISFLTGRNSRFRRCSSVMEPAPLPLRALASRIPTRPIHERTFGKQSMWESSARASR